MTAEAIEESQKELFSAGGGSTQWGYALKNEHITRGPQRL